MRSKLGCIIRRIYWFFHKRKNNLRIRGKCNISVNCTFEGHNSIGFGCLLNSTSVGEGTYMGEKCNFVYSKVGRYCSIGDNVRILAGDHPTSQFISTHPTFYSTQCQAGFTFVESNKYNEIKKDENDISVVIGSDVWIGTDVSIMGNVKIGNGAIIGTKALVTKDCDPYGIYVGIPAKKIGCRFSDEDIEILEGMKWWEQPFQTLKKSANDFTNIENLRKYKKGVIE